MYLAVPVVDDAPVNTSLVSEGLKTMFGNMLTNLDKPENKDKLLGKTNEIFNNPNIKVRENATDYYDNDGSINFSDKMKSVLLSSDYGKFMTAFKFISDLHENIQGVDRIFIKMRPKLGDNTNIQLDKKIEEGGQEYVNLFSVNSATGNLSGENDKYGPFKQVFGPSTQTSEIFKNPYSIESLVAGSKQSGKPSLKDVDNWIASIAYGQFWFRKNIYPVWKY